MVPIMYEFTICYSGNLDLAYARKDKKVRGRGAILVFGFDGEVHPAVHKHLDEEQVQAVVGTIEKYKVYLSDELWGVVIDTRGYSWIPVFLDTWQIFGIQVSKYPKKNMFLRQTS